MGVLDKVQKMIKTYINDKKKEKEFMAELRAEALAESREDIKAGIKQKMKDDYIKKMTTSKGAKVKEAFSMKGLGDVNAKMDRLLGKDSNKKDFNPMNKFVGNSGSNDMFSKEKMDRLLGKKINK